MKASNYINILVRSKKLYVETLFYRRSSKNFARETTIKIYFLQCSKDEPYSSKTLIQDKCSKKISKNFRPPRENPPKSDDKNE
jgi:hypothetical protein